LTTESERLEQLEKAIPDIWKAKTILYVGANAHRFHFNSQLAQGRGLVDVLEVDPDRCEDIREGFPWVNRIFCGDVRRVDKLLRNPYELVLWSHGPTCLELQDIVPTIYRLQDVTSCLLVMMCPWGRYHYSGSECLSDFDVNKTPLDEGFFQDLGFNTSTIGQIDTNGSNLLSWRRKKA
jgi:hypothetical protein